MHIYQVDAARALSGPVHLPLVPGFGLMLPAGFVQLDQALSDPDPGFAWILGETAPEQRQDHRGTAYSTTTGAATQVDQLGPLPADLTTVPRPSPAYRWQGNAWVKDPAYVHATKMVEINTGCESVITGGFWSDALGERHQYGSQLDDQLNLTGVILAGLDCPYACRDELGVKEFRLHTFKQLRQVGDDFTSFKLQLLQKANTLKQQLDQALASDDLAALEAVSWEPAP